MNVRMVALLASIACLWPCHAMAQEHPFLAACRAGKIQQVQQFLDRGTSVDLMRPSLHSKLPVTCLMVATSAGQKEMVQHLLNQGASVDKANIHGLRPLILAVKNGFEDITQLLLTYQANHHAIDGGMPPLAEAIYNAKPGCASILANRVTDVHQLWNGMSALYLASEKGYEGNSKNTAQQRRKPDAGTR